MARRPRWTHDELSRIYDRTGGDCHLCGRRMAWCNYGRVGKRGAWEVEHSVAVAHGGSHRMGNLYGAHISCNRQKATMATRAARREAGRTRAPYSLSKREQLRAEATVGYGAIGALLGGAMAGPPGAAIGAAAGAFLGGTQKFK